MKELKIEKLKHVELSGHSSLGCLGCLGRAFSGYPVLLCILMHAQRATQLANVNAVLRPAHTRNASIDEWQRR